MVGFTSVSWVRRKRNQLKENGIIMFEVTLELCQKVTLINVRKLHNKIMQMGSKNYVVITFGGYVRISLQKSR